MNDTVNKIVIGVMLGFLILTIVYIAYLSWKNNQMRRELFELTMKEKDDETTDKIERLSNDELDALVTKDLGRPAGTPVGDGSNPKSDKP